MPGFHNVHRNKIALVGAGMIGGNMAYLTSLKELGDVVLFDVVPNMPVGKGFDISQNSAVCDHSATIVGTNDYSAMEGADVVIITAGLTKIPGKSDKEWSRTDLLPINSEIMKTVGENIKKYCPKAFIINITNPLDVMVQVLLEHSGVSPHQICGMAGMLDSSRFRRFLADKLQVAPRDVQAMVIGVHGDNMLPLVRYATVNGIPLSEIIRSGWISQQEVDEIVKRVKFAGGEIVSLLGQGSAFYAPATSAITMAESYLKDQKRCIVCSVNLKNKYGVSDQFLGVPCIIGGGGVERIIELDLTPEEKVELGKSIKETQDMLKLLPNRSQNSALEPKAPSATSAGPTPAVVDTPAVHDATDAHTSRSSSPKRFFHSLKEKLALKPKL